METGTMSNHWESDIAALLGELSATQTDLLELLGEKRTLLLQGDNIALEELQPRESELTERLQQCQQRRSELLSLAKEQGMPSDSIHSLANSLPSKDSSGLRPAIADARSRARLLQHESLANWVLIQRTLLHLSQMIEIVATGGRMKPTYGEGASTTGALVDRAV